MFNISDPIFTRQQRVDDSEFEEIEEWSRCGSCGDPSSQTFGKKLKCIKNINCALKNMIDKN